MSMMSILLGLLVVTTIIFLHELGHFAAAKMLGVPAPLFSVGLGPVLLRKTWGGTEYRLSAIPFGGFVLFGRGENLDATKASERIVIYLAGPLANFLTAFIIFGGDGRLFLGQMQGVLSALSMLLTGNAGFDQLLGPIGLMGVAGDHAAAGIVQLLGFTALLSINLGILNLLPLPVLDGGQILIAMIEGLSRRRIHMKVRIAMALVCWALLILLMVQATIGDVARWHRAPPAAMIPIEWAAG
ncbi:site-2 protease family protein [bacterium]|nr:site-2 protease family protein [bacterium]